MNMDEEMQRAIQFHGTNALIQAEDILKKILEKNPTHAHASHLLGIIAYQNNKINLAIQLIQNAIISNPNIALFHSNLGEMHRLLKSLQLSIELGQRAVGLDPASATAWSNLGIAYFDNKEYEKAENCHQRALLINPNLGASLNNMGSIYQKCEDTKKAIAFYEKAIKATPQLVEPYNNLGVIYLNQKNFKQASVFFKHAIIFSPHFVEANCNLGLTLLHLDQIDNAMFYFEKTLQLQPSHAEAYYGIAKVHLEKQDFILAENNIRKAIAIHPSQVDFYQLLASIYNEKGDNLKALFYLEHAISMNATLPSLILSKGSIFMEMGEITKAEEEFLKIANDPTMDTSVAAHYSLVQLRKIKSGDDSMEALLSMLHQVENISPEKQVYLYFALGKCFDDLGEWHQAFQYFKQGCDLKRKSISYHSYQQIELTQQIIRCFTPKTIEYLRNFSNPSSLPIFIVGMPRAGSTLLEQILSNHTLVHGAGELKYFNHLIHYPIKNNGNIFCYPENILHSPPENYQNIIEQYLHYLRYFSHDAKYITDKMLYNFIYIGMIHALLPNAKIIHVKRNPIDTCLSCYTKLFREAQLYSYDLQELGEYYICYERTMNHWREILPHNAWLDVDYENIVKNLEFETKRILAFCDLTWDPACIAFYQSKRQVRTASFMQVRKPIYTSSVNRWHHFQNELTPLITILNQEAFQSVAQQQV